MKKNFSPMWISSKQPRKQRKYRAYAPLHLRGKMMSAHLSKSLRTQYKRRAVPVRTGDEVTIIAGEYRKKQGKISKVDLKKYKIFIEGVTTKKVTGQDVQVPIDPSNVVVTRVKTDDSKRLKMLRRKGEVKEEPAKEKKKEEKKENAPSAK